MVYSVYGVTKVEDILNLGLTDTPITRIAAQSREEIIDALEAKELLPDDEFHFTQDRDTVLIEMKNGTRDALLFLINEQ